MALRRLRVAVVGLVVAAAIATTSGATADAASATGSPGGIPVAGQVATLGARSGGVPLVVTVHTVRRAAAGTIVYYSVGFPDDPSFAARDADHDSVYIAARRSLGGTLPVFMQDTGKVGARFCDVAALDNAGARLYTYVADGVCTEEPRPSEWELGKAYVFAVGLPALPPAVDRVDVSIRGSIVQDVPVEEGILAPQTERDTAPVLGTAWPKVDPAQAGTTPEKSIYPLYQAVSDLEGTITQTATTLDLNTDVLFAHDSATISGAGKQAIAQAAEQLTARGVAGTVHVVGHTDSDGTEAYNLTLSTRRATAVVEALAPLLGPGIDLVASGKGETEPVADNATSDGKARNRRVTISFAPAGAR